LTKIPRTYSVSCFNLRGLGPLFGGLSLPKTSRGDGTGIDPMTILVSHQAVPLHFTRKLCPWWGPVTSISLQICASLNHRKKI